MNVVNIFHFLDDITIYFENKENLQDLNIKLNQVLNLNYKLNISTTNTKMMMSKNVETAKHKLERIKL